MKSYKYTYDSIFTDFNLNVSVRLSQQGKKDYYQIKEFNENSKELMESLKETLKNREYVTCDYYHFKLQENGKTRDIYKLNYFPHRIVQNCLINQTKYYFMSKYIEETYAAIPNKGMHKCMRKIRGYMLKHPKETKYCLKIDLAKYFPHVDHTILKEIVGTLFKDKELVSMWNEIIESHNPGLPIGSYTSQYLANIYLYKFDIFCKHNYKYYGRYMDDIVILGSSREELLRIYRDIEWMILRDYNCTIKHNWQIFEVSTRGIDFVGFRVYPNCVMLRKTTLLKLIRVTTKIKKFVDKNGYMTERMRSQMGSYLGWIKGCTHNVKMRLYDKYFRETYLNAGITNIEI